MNFSNTKQIVIMTILSAALLTGIDALKNPQVFTNHQETVRYSGMQVTLVFNHLCCTGCLGTIQNALAPVGWMSHEDLQALNHLQVRSKDDANRQSGPLADYGNQVTLPIHDIRLVDFMDLDRATRSNGLVIARMLLGGVSHFNFVVDMGHMCCSLCATADKTGLNYARALSSAGNLSWMEGADTDVLHSRVTIYSKFVPTNATVDITDLIRTFNQIGFEPKSIRVDVNPENTQIK